MLTTYAAVPGAGKRKPRVILTFTDCERSHARLLGRAEERVAKLVDSPDRPESEASYKLDEGGWADV